jgi:putative transposase
MGRSRYKYYESNNPYFISSSIVNGLPIFSIPEAANIVIQSLTFLQKQRNTTIFAYVIMENHLHAIIKGKDLSNKIGKFKSFTAHEIRALLFSEGHTHWLRVLKSAKRIHKTRQRYQLWAEGFHPQQLDNVEMLIQKIDYIHNNPVKRGYVDIPEHWRYSSARNYAGMEGLLEVALLDGFKIE